MKALVAAILVALTVAMAFGHGVLTRPILADDQLYFFMTERCASGVPPHVAQMEVKTQLPTMIGGATVALARRAGLDDVRGGRIATVTAAAIATVLAWLFVLEVTGSAGAALVGAAAMLSIYGLYMEAATGFQPKVPMVAFLMAAHLASARRRAFVAGLMAACAFLCWQPAALVAGACGLALVVDRRAKWSDLARFAAGVLVAMAAYEAWFWWQGALAQQLHQEWVLAFGAETNHKPFDWKDSVWFVLTEAQTFRPRPDGLPSVFVLVTALAWLGSLAMPKRAWETLRESPGLVSFWSAAHVATAFTLYDHQAHPDMLLVQPYFAIACGVGAAWVDGWLRRLPRGGAVAALAMAAFVAAGLYDARRDVQKAIGGSTGLERQLAQARIADLYADHRGSLYVLGSIHLLGLSHRDNWTPVGNVGHESREFDMKTYRPLRDGKMPEIIIAGRGLRPGAASWLPREYVDITPAILAMDRIRVFSRLSPAEPAFAKGQAPKPSPGPKPRTPPQVGPPKPAAPAKPAKPAPGAQPAAAGKPAQPPARR